MREDVRQVAAISRLPAALERTLPARQVRSVEDADGNMGKAGRRTARLDSLALRPETLSHREKAKVDRSN